jgi:superfamily II DNA or RNA helicase
VTIKLRPYQEESLEIIKETKHGEKTLIVLPTGSGKGILLAALSAQAEGRVLIVVPTKELREQNQEKIEKIDSTIDVGSVQATLDEVQSKVVIASRQSLTHPKSNRIKRMLEHGKFEYVVIDEVHQAVDQVVKIVNRLNKDAKIIGLTATPYNKELKKVFSKIDYRKAILEMIDEEYLCEPKAIMIKSKTDLRHVKIVAGEFNQKELEIAVNNIERNQLVIKSYFEYAKDRKSTLVFASGIDHCKSLVGEFKRNEVDARYIDSNTHKDEREKIIEDFKNFRFPVLVNVGVLTTGFDHQPTDCVILARPTKSKILYEQIIGRGLRLSPETNKEDCLIVDINDVVKNHDLMSLANVFGLRDIKNGEKPKQAKKRIEKEDLEEAERLRQEELRKQEAERKRLEEIQLQAQKVRLFNKDMKKRFSEGKYDWFRVDNLTYALSYELTKHYVIEQVETNDKSECYLFRVNTDKNEKDIEFVTSHNQLSELITYTESVLIRRENSMVSVNADWKKGRPTDNQLKYVSWANNKWDVHTYFNGNSIKSLMKNSHLLIRSG